MKSRILLRNVVAVLATCLAATTMFWACTSDEPGNPDDPHNPPDDPSGTFTKKTFNTPQEIQAFIPAGIYEFGGDYFGSSKNFVAFGTDGSFIDGTLSDYSPKVTICLNSGVNVQNVLWDTDLNTPRWVRQEYYNVPTDGSGVYENFDYMDMSIFVYPLTLFITSDNCEKDPTSVSDAQVAGVSVKHYVYKTTYGSIVMSSEYWVTTSGLCLKYRTSTGTEDDPTSGSLWTDSVSYLTNNVGNYNDILSKLPQFDHISSSISDYNGLFRITYGKYANEWLLDQYSRTLDNWIRVYSASGTIKYMEVWHNPEQAAYEGWTSLNLSVDGATHQDVLNYIASVMTVNGMTQTSFTDQDIDGTTLLMFEGDNSSIVVNSGDYWVAYKISLYNSTLSINIRIWRTIFV